MSEYANSSVEDSLPNYDMPSRKAILQYLVRMGSFTSAPKILNEDTADNDVILPDSSSWDEMKHRCEKELSGWLSNISRPFVNIVDSDGESIRVMQWNVLSQALAEGSDKFVMCPPEALAWQTRRWKILFEMVSVQPDVLCLQEVDHFQFFQRALGSIGFTGFFCPKPDSPCLYIPGNNGPDGCALFINTARFDILECRNRCLEVWGCQTNQVSILCKLKRRFDDAELWVATTHLKARPGPFLAALRKEQGCDLLCFMQRVVGKNAHLLLAGDMNAHPKEPVHSVFKNAGLESAYLNQEPSFTSWTIREDGEVCKTLDYILYSEHLFHVERLLRLPCDSDIGPNRVPSHCYPSDHFALVADFTLTTS